MGDVFGAPLALEGLAAFFLESVFLGLWIFGWGKLPEKIHLLTIWAVALGTTLSAYFIIAANSFMQHPVGAALNPETGRAELVGAAGGDGAVGGEAGGQDRPRGPHAVRRAARSR